MHEKFHNEIFLLSIVTITGHGVELPFVFHTATLGGFNYTQAELLLTDDMVHYWTNFAHHGDPNGVQTEVTCIPLYLYIL